MNSLLHPSGHSFSQQTRFGGPPSMGAPLAALHTSKGGEVSFQWHKTEVVADNVGFNGCVSGAGADREASIGLSMVLVQGASTGSLHKSSKGWKSIKSGMDYVLGRSIVPAARHKLRDMSLAAAEDVLPSPQKMASSHRCSLKARSGSGHPLKSTETTHCDSQNELSHPLVSDELSNGTANRLHFFERNAVAGAVAGMCVSLCLHPIDTVKTVIQSQSFGGRSVVHTLLSTISDRGVLGLYRGLGSNLASSAPISAIYTFTYESIKAALVPCLPKEYHAIAYSVAGGCASIATSIVYTPSECVKQRMQVGGLHSNSWQAFLSILRNEGPTALYTGWVAVLCRNIPQSIIKFYTYEGLKHWALSKQPDGMPLSIHQTLAFGGLAGCTAAIFTTPFDVIKTRLQTQSAGLASHKQGVLQVFQHVMKSEGLGGLYRGLLPRLVIYLSQGALFFATYEFFKRVLEMDAPKFTILSCYSTESETAAKQQSQFKVLREC